MTETCIFKHAVVLKSISSSPHWNIGRSSIRPVGYYIFVRPTLNRMWQVKSLSQGLSVCSFIMNRNDQNFLFLVRKCWFKKTNSFGRNSLLVTDLLGNASELQESHCSCRHPKREMGAWTGTRRCCHICLAIAPSSYSTHWRGHFSLHCGQVILCEGANITKDQNYVVTHQSVTNLACILFLHRRRKYWRLSKVPWHGNIIFHPAQIKSF